MTAVEFYSLAGLAIFLIGIYGLITRSELIIKILALNIMGSGVFLLLVAIAMRVPAGQTPDPVPHALVLTGIVVAFSATALALALVKRIYSETGRTTLDAFCDAMDPEAPHG